MTDTVTATDNLVATYKRILVNTTKGGYLEALNSQGIYGMPAIALWEESVACAFCKDLMEDCNEAD